ncbi:MAG: hypothetical protein L6Q71_07940 [Planctomycetes bacterium]|nr:hypothetical protein [Planctomycetota bacterium]NUQ33354.1 hypothetical protein [Planctomycetaceae bacterium]
MRKCSVSAFGKVSPNKCGGNVHVEKIVHVSGVIVRHLKCCKCGARSKSVEAPATAEKI